MREVQCSEAVEFLETLANIQRNPVGLPRPDRFAFRGQADSTWELIPSAFRVGTALGYELRHHAHVVCPEMIDSWEQANAEYYAIYEFLQLADSLGLEVPGDSYMFRGNARFRNVVGNWELGIGDWPKPELLELLAIAQHHGVPTRLLDFSFRPGVAVFFALSDDANTAADGQFAVWAVDLDFIAWSAIHGDRIGLVTVPRARNTNLHAQHGLFLYDMRRQKNDPVELNRIIEIEAERVWKTESSRSDWVPITKVVAPRSIAGKVLMALELDGFDEPHLRPSFDAVVACLLTRRQQFLR
jgi:hypothetical protein